MVIREKAIATIVFGRVTCLSFGQNLNPPNGKLQVYLLQTLKGEIHG